jgi:CheY-like chemotaxis protein
MSTPDQSPAVRNLSVLLAEDSPLHRRHSVQVLEDAGHRVTTVTNGQEALEALPHGQFDVVLMDVEMPVIDGPTATRMIRQREANRESRLPIVAVTSTNRKADCLNAGMDAFLPKPLEPELLKTTLDSLLARTAAW